MKEDPSPYSEGPRGPRTCTYLANGTDGIALLSEAPACGLSGHEGFGEKEEQIARARDGEVDHDATPAARWPPMVHGECIC